ncbi:hypothetical protein ILYODFUR_029997 [Ilyodon furcidens]|uniref:Uncharacterized protein n=1 Tax=Ilyodon furcidens TaxID=33524 RepID=A0ABV0T1E3_9TELE
MIPVRMKCLANSLNTAVFPLRCCRLLCSTVSHSVSVNSAFPGSAVTQGPSSLLEQQAKVQKMTPLVQMMCNKPKNVLYKDAEDKTNNGSCVSKKKFSALKPGVQK